MEHSNARRSLNAGRTCSLSLSHRPHTFLAPAAAEGPACTFLELCCMPCRPMHELRLSCHKVSRCASFCCKGNRRGLLRRLPALQAVQAAAAAGTALQVCLTRNDKCCRPSSRGIRASAAQNLQLKLARWTACRHCPAGNLNFDFAGARGGHEGKRGKMEVKETRHQEIQLRAGLAWRLRSQVLLHAAACRWTV